MAKSYVLRVPLPLWNEVVELNEREVAKSLPDLARDLMREGIRHRKAGLPAPLQPVAPATQKEKKKNTINNNTLKFLSLRVYDFEESELYWVHEREDEGLFLKKLEMLRDAGVRMDQVGYMRDLATDIIVPEEDIEEDESLDSQAETAWRMVEEYREKLDKNQTMTMRPLNNPYLEQVLGQIRR